MLPVDYTNTKSLLFLMASMSLLIFVTSGSHRLLWTITVTTSLELLLHLFCFIKHFKFKCFTVAYKIPHDLLHAYLSFNTFPIYAL